MPLRAHARAHACVGAHCADSALTRHRRCAALRAALGDCADSARQYAETLRYLGETMLYHHSIDSLVPALSASARFASTVPGAPLP